MLFNLFILVASVVFLYVAFALPVLVVHEGGHALMGALTGNNVKGFGLLPMPHVNVEYDKDKIQEKNLNVQILLVSAGGILGQLVLEAVWFFVFGLESDMFLYGTIINAVTAVINLLPFALEQLFMKKNHFITTDGKKIYMVVNAMIHGEDLAKKLEELYPSDVEVSTNKKDTH